MGVFFGVFHAAFSFAKSGMLKNDAFMFLPVACTRQSLFEATGILNNDVVVCCALVLFIDVRALDCSCLLLRVVVCCCGSRRRNVSGTAKQTSVSD